MRIAQVAPLHESVPPKHYGGTERIVSHLTEELVRGGHEVTLFGSGDSVTGARLIAPCPRSLRKNERCKDPVAREVILIDHVVEHAQEFDLIHFHSSLPSFCYLSSPARSTCDDFARASRYPGPGSSLSAVSRCAGHLDFQRAARSLTMGKLAGHHLSWIAETPIPVLHWRWRLPRVSRENISRKTSRQSDRNREANRNAPQDCCQSRSRG